MDIFAICIDLSQEEVGYLSNAGFLGSTQIEFIRNVEWLSPYSAKLRLSPDVAEMFREAFTEQLAKVGFDERYEPTAEGQILEALIDRFCISS